MQDLVLENKALHSFGVIGMYRIEKQYSSGICDEAGYEYHPCYPKKYQH
jgi:hypothetical protein